MNNKSQESTNVSYFSSYDVSATRDVTKLWYDLLRFKLKKGFYLNYGKR